MTDYLLQRGVSEVKGNANFAYVLQDNEQFNTVGYKVMTSNEMPTLLKVVKLSLNGHIKLIYLTNGYQNFNTMLHLLPPGGIWTLCGKILEGVVRVRDQGFLIGENLDLALHRILFDPGTCEVKMVYLPLRAGEEDTTLEFDSQVKQILLDAVKYAGDIKTEQETRFIGMMSNTATSMDDLLQYLKVWTGMPEKKSTHNQPRIEKRLRLTGQNPYMTIDREMQGNILRVGRRKDNDIVLDYSNKIHRYYFYITKKDDAFYLRDDNTTGSGTKRNGQFISSCQDIQLQNGDSIAVPGMEFKVEIR